jgi:glycosyltransferase involved in cell wall biosynthesis
MKILYFMNSCHNFLGAPRSVALLASNLPEGMQAVAVFPDEGRAVEGFRSRGIRSIVVQAPDALNLTDKKLINISHVRQAAIFARHIVPYSLRLIRLIRREKPDIVHCQAGRAVLIVGWAARLCRKPVIWHLRGENILKKYWVLDFAAHRLATSVVTVADALKDGIRSTIPSRTIYNGIDFDCAVAPESISVAIDTLLADRGFDPRITVKVVSTSAFLPHKGLHHLQQALHELLQKHPELSDRVAWLILGEANSEEKHRYERYLRNRAAELRIEKNMFWVGWQDNGASWIAAGDVTVLPTVKDEMFRYDDGRELRLISTEGLPRTLLESLAAGRPSIASEVGGVRELICHGENGFVVQPGNSHAIAHALKVLVTDVRRRTEMGVNARRSAERFTVQQCVQRTVQLYQQLVSARMRDVS